MILFGWSQRSEASPLWAQAVGAGCVPDSATINAHLYETAGFGVRFAPNATGTIRLICPWGQEPTDGKLGGIRMSYTDSDGMDIKTRVRVSVWYAQEGSNISYNVGTCDSNTDSKTGPHTLWCSFPTIHNVASDRLYWYVVTIDRFDATKYVEFLGADLLYQP
jgi:hypothetical protein